MNQPSPRGIRQLFLDATRAAAAEDEVDNRARAPLLDDERLLQALRGEKALTAAEQRLLILSLETRERFVILQRVEQIRAEDADDDEGADDAAEALRSVSQAYWDACGWNDGPITLLAAADDKPRVEPIRVKKKLYSVDLIPIDIDGREWRINIQIARQELEAFRENTSERVQLVDDEGKVWAEGTPNQQGELVAFLEDDEGLMQRLLRCPPTLKPL